MALVDAGREAEPDRRDVLRQLADRRHKAVQEGLLGGDRGRVLYSLVHLPPRVDDAGQDLRPAEVDADDTVRLHARGVT